MADIGAVVVRLPANLRDLTEGAAAVSAEGASVADVIADLDRRWPGLAQRLLDDSGLRRYVNVYRGGSDVRLSDGLATALEPGDLVTILPAAGLAPPPPTPMPAPRP